ncbi:hypothetical protein CTO_1009 [Chlamydia trachomatis A2497]|uniref:Uncharacterized protein n=1 Tax=Chlamydia trachomatis serovar A (strain A2497) TaxID=580047 RepID=G4NPL5_CHLT4|nr:hypothetical protein CTO_1009 [Chlamydia trachomatis A2497]
MLHCDSLDRKILILVEEEFSHEILVSFILTDTSSSCD